MPFGRPLAVYGLHKLKQQLTQPKSVAYPQGQQGGGNNYACCLSLLFVLTIIKTAYLYVCLLSVHK